MTTRNGKPDESAKIAKLREFAAELFHKGVPPAEALAMLKAKIIELEITCAVKDKQIFQIFRRLDS